MSAGKCISGDAYLDAAQKQADAIKRQAVAEAALNIALALWQRNSSKSVASMQQKIAKRNIKLAREVFDHATKFWPCQESLVKQAFGEAKAPIQSDALAAQYRGFGTKAMGEGREDWFNDAKRHCFYVSPCDVARWDRIASATDADLITFGDRQAEARAQTLNDRRYERMVSALALGKGIIRDVDSFHRISGEAGMSAAGLLQGSLNSGLEAVGYHMRRDRTVRWDASNPNYRLPYRVQRSGGNTEAPADYDVIIGTAKDEPIEIGGCIKPTREEMARNPQAYKDYLVCSGRYK